MPSAALAPAQPLTASRLGGTFDTRPKENTVFPAARPEAADLSVLLAPVPGTGRPAVRGVRPPPQADTSAAPPSLQHQQSIRDAVQVGHGLGEFGLVFQHVLIHFLCLPQHEEACQVIRSVQASRWVLDCRHVHLICA